MANWALASPATSSCGPTEQERSRVSHGHETIKVSRRILVMVPELRHRLSRGSVQEANNLATRNSEFCSVDSVATMAHDALSD